MTAEQIRLAMENKLEYLMEVKPQLASDDQLYKAAALVLRDLMVEKRRAHRAKTTAERKKRIHYLSMEFLMGYIQTSCISVQIRIFHQTLLTVKTQ